MKASSKTFLTQGRKLAFVAALVIGSSALSAFAEPYMAVRTGFKCSQCHLNQSGGAGRTEYGHAYTQYKLVMEQTQALIRNNSNAGLTSFDPKLNDAITIGGNFRTEGVISQKEGALPSDRNHRFAESNVYFNFELVKNFLSFYVDQDMGTGSNREIWMMARNLPGKSYVKIGRTLLPYGYRIMDDQAFIRDKTNYNYGRKDLAGEVGFEPGPLSVIANLTNDNFSTVGSVVFRNFRVGGSYATSTEGPTTSMYGPFVGASYGIFTALAEMDFIKEELSGVTYDRVAHFYELNVVPVQGINVKTTYEFFDRNTKVANKRDGQERWTFGAELFPIQHLQVGAYYRLNRGIPQADAENQDQIITRAHVFF